MPTMWTLIKWLPWQQQLERSGSSSGIDRGAGVELTPAGGTRTEGGTQDPHPSMTYGLFQTPTTISSETQSGCHAQGWKRSHQKHRCHLSRQPPKTDALSCSESHFSWESGHTRMQARARTHLSLQHPPPPVEADPPLGSCWVRELLHGDRHYWCHPLQRRVTAMFLSGRLSSELGWGCLQC